MGAVARVFEDKPATRDRTPLLVGIVGPSGGGKTYSALRLATGIQRVSPGEIFVVDTEANRSKHYARHTRNGKVCGFEFRHVAFGAPFSPLDYLGAIEHCVKQGARTIVVDSLSHEHEGAGGVLEMHDVELARLGGEPKHSMRAWQKPKAARQRLINSMLQMECNFILCFRAKEKLRIVPGKDPVPRGFCPIAGQEFVYEMVAKFLLPPGANGVPQFDPEHPDERLMVKLPEQFHDLFREARQLSEDVGEELARWAAGDDAPVKLTALELATSYAACSDAVTLRGLEASRRALWTKASKAEKEALKSAADAAQKRIADATTPTPPADVPVDAPRAREPGDDDDAQQSGPA